MKRLFMYFFFNIRGQKSTMVFPSTVLHVTLQCWTGGSTCVGPAYLYLNIAAVKSLDVLMDGVRYCDLCLSAGSCSCAVNVIPKPLYPLWEDLQCSRSNVSLSALKLQDQQPPDLCLCRRQAAAPKPWSRLLKSTESHCFNLMNGQMKKLRLA